MPGLMQKFKDLWNPPEEEYDDYDYEEEQQEEPAPRPHQAPRAEQQSSPSVSRRERTQTAYARSNSDGKVVNINNSRQLQVVIFKPQHFGEETCAVADELIHTNTVVLNLEETQKDIARRIIDFLSGVAYANGGKIKRVATNTFIITPYNVDLMGEDNVEDSDNGDNATYY
ncbi:MULTISPECIES: cell division protein SepF [Caproicibacterium]|jgi:cell division inhibitor SepF|uniref:Cell division protein SepF n=1 Tax=Caproicibacterium lactatifermentans TaxID=2666138 RepID=A0A859DVQ4_9FIRM|nr:cell division protein SepF [Caproicibacterium lactatifermentans]ARP50176.1 hypothetical protein B6259_04345 [Ruminococcaceae bacterium CPB6]MDD4807948.1 cell division protein SepF [Oscillospiraceae bacterium]QKN24101.1 DUF552 domain-containing protein [Caproicibacterium lactatifermentans]QKO30831.1 DUF552 domain-containing protein [Caproicibacterium lactatifermentans]